MIIKAQFKTFGFCISIISVIGGAITLVYCFIYGLGKTPVAAQIALYGILVLLISIYGKILYDANLITIDTAEQTIKFINLFTRHHLFYKFSDLDGKLVWYEPVKGGYAKNLYFIQNKKAVKKISGFIYSNQKELEEALADIKDLGNIKYSFLKSWKVFFGYPIID